MRILAIDWGERRFGLALTDPMNITAQPLTVIECKPPGALWDDLGKIIEDYGVQTVVVGLPLRTDDKPGQKEAMVRAWIEKARRVFPKINFVELDERFTTKEAQRILREKQIRAKDQRKIIDKIAAALILEQYLRISRP